MTILWNKWNPLIASLFAALVLMGCSVITDKNNNASIEAVQSGYVQVDQGQLFFQIFGQGEPIIVLHGGPGLDQSYFLPQMLELAKDHQVIFYDQRGSGKSLNTPLDTQHINIDQFVKDLEALRISLGLKHFILIGHSWGGLLAMGYVTKHPTTVSRLVLLNSAPANYKGQQDLMKEFIKRTEPLKDKITAFFSYEDFEKLNAQEISALYRNLFSVYFDQPKNVEYLTLTMNPASARSGFKVMEEMSKTSWLQPHINLFPALEKVNVPTLVIHGNQDLIPVHTVQEIANTMPNSQIIYLEKCGHYPYIEQPETLFSEIRKFLERK